MTFIFVCEFAVSLNYVNIYLESSESFGSPTASVLGVFNLLLI